MHQFYNQALSSTEMERLDWENFVVLMSGQALLGSVTSQMIYVGVEFREEDEISLNAILDGESSTSRYEIAFAADSLTDLLSGRANVSANVRVQPDYRPPSPSNSNERCLFKRRTISPIDNEQREGLKCARCGRTVLCNRDHFEVFENMHWVCFHYEFEHHLGDETIDEDQSCRDPSCPSRAFDPNPQPSW